MNHTAASAPKSIQEADAIGILSGLAQTHRLRVFRSLVSAGEAGQTPGAMSELLGIPAATLSFHLKELAQAGLISHERQGRSIVYRANIFQVSQLIEYLLRDCCGGEAQALRMSQSSPFWARLTSEACPTFTGLPAATNRVFHVLFLCTGNSCRSPMAEAMLNHLGAGRFRAYSAGSRPNGFVAPEALAVLEGFGIPADGLHSKGWENFVKEGAPSLDFVFTVCDRAAGEICPVWPGAPVTANWSVEDPANGANNDERLRLCREAAIVLRRRIELFLSLPLATVDRMALGGEVSGIGQK